jgi:hypothetical protein
LESNGTIYKEMDFIGGSNEGPKSDY